MKSTGRKVVVAADLCSKHWFFNKHWKTWLAVLFLRGFVNWEEFIDIFVSSFLFKKFQIRCVFEIIDPYVYLCCCCCCNSILCLIVFKKFYFLLISAFHFWLIQRCYIALFLYTHILTWNIDISFVCVRVIMCL